MITIILSADFFLSGPIIVEKKFRQNHAKHLENIAQLNVFIVLIDCISNGSVRFSGLHSVKY